MMGFRAGTFFLLSGGLALLACGDDGAGTSVAMCEGGCNVPPMAECLSDVTLRSYASPGVCGADGSCTYGHVDFTCDNGCAAGACVGEVDPCAEVVCVDPPAARCVEGGLETFASLGSCAQGTCAYASVVLPCTHGCVDGACAGDPCAGVVCDEPPSACHAPTGTCNGGVCSYAVLAGAACDDGLPCSEDDRCGANGTCAGTAIACQSPGASVCDGDVLRVPAATGTCDAGQCSYPVTEVPCPDGCADGKCLGDPCAGVVCDDPPSACHADRGTCQDGVCAYAFDNGAACDDGDPCSDEDRCTNGVCAGGARACTTPEPAVCKDSETLIARASTGSCSEGACSYVAIEVPCAFGCVEVDGVGGCEGDPCAGVTCNAPPPATCANATSLVVPAPTGLCAGGSCNYDTVVFTCTHGCQAGSADVAAFCKPPAGLVIGEVLVDSAGFPDEDAFVEIHGPPGTRLDGVSIVGINGNGGADYVAIELSGTLDSQGLFVVAHPESADAIAGVADLLDDDVDLQNGPDSVQLRYGAIVLDALAYGTFETSDVARGEGTPHPLAPTGESLSRDALYTDSDDNAADFSSGTPTPAAPLGPSEVAPVVALSCPAGGLVGEVLSFDASASTGSIASFTFDFGDGSDLVQGAATSQTHAFATPGVFTVTATATSAGGLTDSGSCDVVIAPDEEPVTYEGDEVCMPAGQSYVYDVISNPVTPATDGKLTVRYKGTSPYNPKPYTIEIQLGADDWEAVAVTNDSKNDWQTQNFRVPQATIEAAIAGMGWIRFRHSYQYNGSANDCMELTFVYNCELCFACPAGQEDLGIGCQPVGEPYDYTSLEHPTGRCGASSFDQLYLPGTPPAAGDGTLSLEFLGCESTSIDVDLFTANSGWVEIGSGSAPSCSFGKATWTIPEAYLDQAIDEDHRMRFRWSLRDSCAAGMGCSSYNDPCVKNAHLTYPR